MVLLKKEAPASVTSKVTATSEPAQTGVVVTFVTCIDCAIPLPTTPKTKNAAIQKVRTDLINPGIKKIEK